MAVRLVATRLGTEDPQATQYKANEGTGRLLKTVMASYMAPARQPGAAQGAAQGAVDASKTKVADAYTVLFLGTLWTDKGQAFLNDLLHNESLCQLAGLGEVWQGLARRVTSTVSTQELMIRPAFMHLALCGPEVQCVTDSLGLAGRYLAFSTVFEQAAASGQFQPVIAHCEEHVGAATAAGGDDEARRALKAFLVACIYHDYYRTNQLPSLAALVPLVAERLRQILALSGHEEGVLLALVSPATHMSLFNDDNLVSQAFQLGVSDWEVDGCMRHALVNALTMFMYAPTNFFSTCIRQPRSLAGTYGLLATRDCPIGAVHYDCNTVLDEHGRLDGAGNLPQVGYRLPGSTDRASL